MNQPHPEPVVAGYRRQSPEHLALINEVKAAGAALQPLIDKLRRMPATNPQGEPEVMSGAPTLDQRWISIGVTDLQKAFMALVRGVAQPTTLA